MPEKSTKEFRRIETTLAPDTECACCDPGNEIAKHEAEYFDCQEVEIHIAVTEAFNLAERAHEALRRAALMITPIESSLAVASALRRAGKLRQACDLLRIHVRSGE